MGILTWIIFGALAGWVASILAGTNARQGCLINVVVGIIGAFIGGLVMQLVTGYGFNFGFNVPSFIVAVVGSLILLILTGAARRSSN